LLQLATESKARKTYTKSTFCFAFENKSAKNIGPFNRINKGALGVRVEEEKKENRKLSTNESAPNNKFASFPFDMAEDRLFFLATTLSLGKHRNRYVRLHNVLLLFL
jgi:hypothetical protein